MSKLANSPDFQACFKDNYTFQILICFWPTCDKGGHLFATLRKCFNLSKGLPARNICRCVTEKPPAYGNRDIGKAECVSYAVSAARQGRFDHLERCSDLRQSVLRSHTAAPISGPVKLLMHTSLTTGVSGTIGRRPAAASRDEPAVHTVSSGNLEIPVVGAPPPTSAMSSSTHGRQPE